MRTSWRLLTCVIATMGCRTASVCPGPTPVTGGTPSYVRWYAPAGAELGPEVGLESYWSPANGWVADVEVSYKGDLRGVRGILQYTRAKSFAGTMTVLVEDFVCEERGWSGPSLLQLDVGESAPPSDLSWTIEASVEGDEELLRTRRGNAYGPWISQQFNVTFIGD